MHHIFFQIKCKLIIQMSEGKFSNTRSSLNNKVYLNNVTQRYKTIKLLPDWYAGPGKRKKCIQRDKIRFLELSHVMCYFRSLGGHHKPAYGY